MNNLLSLLNKNPLLLIALSIAVGIVMGFNDNLLSWCISSVLLLSSICYFFFLNFKSRNIQFKLKYRNFYWVWVILLFLGLGMITATINYPAKINSATLDNSSHILAIVSDKSTLTTGDKLIVKICGLANCNQQYNFKSNCYAELNTKATNAQIGDKIVFRNNLHEISDNGNFYDFDYKKFMLHRGIRYKQFCNQSDIKIIKKNITIKSYAENIKDNIIILIENSGLKKHTQNFVSTILLGDNSFIDPDVKNDFADAGIAHILALSGLHIGIIIIILNLILYPLNIICYKKFKYILIIILVWMFAFITGLSASVVRAAIMTTFYFTALILERQNSALNSISAAAIIILIVSPQSLFDVGFQLSFAATLGIIIFVNKANHILDFHYKLLNKIASAVAVSSIAIIFTWAFSAYYFHSFPILFLPANLIVVWILPYYLFLALLHIALLSFNFDFNFLSTILDYGYQFIYDIANFISNIPYSTIEIWVSPISVALYYVTLLIFAYLLCGSKNKSVTTKWTILFAAITTISIPILPNNKPKDGFIVQNRWDSSLIRVYKDGKDSLVILPEDSIYNFYIFNKKVVSIDNNDITKFVKHNSKSTDLGYSNKLFCDYLLVSDGYGGNLSDIYKIYNPKVTIIMPSVFSKKQDNFTIEADSLSKQIYFIDKMGAYKYYDSID